MNTRARSPAPRGRSPGPVRGRSPTGRSPKRTFREPSPGHSAAPSVRRERRNSYSSHASGVGEVRRRRSSVSPVPPMPRGRTGANGESEMVRVVLRVRPFNGAEEEQSAVPCLIPPQDDEATGVTFIDPRAQYADDYDDEAHNTFHFDRVFYPQDIHNPPRELQDSEQHEVYQMIGPQCLTNLFESYNSCVFAYGQTGSGKTHTMMGGMAEGIIPRFCRELLSRYEALPQVTQQTIKLQASFIEIYCEHLYDLMCDDTSHKKQGWIKHGDGNTGRLSSDNRRRLSLRQHPVHGLSVAGATTFSVSTYGELEAIVQQGMAARSTASTTMNDQSSRSHAMFQITMEMQVPNREQRHGFHRREQATTFSTASMRFVDLAGSENLKKSGSNGDRMHESIHINTSLLALRRVIDQLLEKGSVPGYRDSKLTRLLSDCLGGNSKTWFLACVSPSQLNAEETKNTLRYAAKATRIVNHVSRNMDVGARMEEDLVHLREELALARGSEVEDLKTLISQYEGTLSDVQQDMERMRAKQDEQQRVMREQQDEAERALAQAKQEMELSLQEASENNQRARATHTAEMQRIQQEAERFRKKLESKEEAMALHTQELQKTRALAQERGAEMKRVETTLAEQVRRADEEKKVWEEIAMDMERDLITQKRHWKEANEETTRRHQEAMEALRAELVENFQHEMKEKDDDHEEQLSDLKKLNEEYKGQVTSLNDELVKLRLQHAAAMAAHEQKYERERRDWDEEAEEIRRMQTEDKTRLASDVRGMRMGLESEVQQRRSEIQDLKRRHKEDLLRERERAEKAHTMLAEAEIRANNVESKFNTIDNDMRNMEEVHGKAQRLVTAVEERDFEGHQELINLMKEVCNWGKQLKSLRTNFTSLVQHRGRPEHEDFLPTQLEPVDPSQGRHRRSCSSRRLRKM
eukprot:TRINITY_DN26810_c0_g1_i3.p1 TRINITY_DN26810_c0_g1~~TRINITY_DN26810_c0_g1_i3.p1  ORF type:complete len:921 (+),score=356.87 TRINITY_DN26810_c0_g1_i3:59-2821(+)